MKLTDILKVVSDVTNIPENEITSKSKREDVVRAKRLFVNCSKKFGYSTTTLPITLTLNGTSRPLTFFGGAAVTVADLAGTGVILVFNDRYNGILQTFPVAPATAG